MSFKFFPISCDNSDFFFFLKNNILLFIFESFDIFGVLMNRLDRRKKYFDEFFDLVFVEDDFALLILTLMIYLWQLSDVFLVLFLILLVAFVQLLDFLFCCDQFLCFKEIILSSLWLKWQFYRLNRHQDLKSFCLRIGCVGRFKKTQTIFLYAWLCEW